MSVLQSASSYYAHANAATRMGLSDGKNKAALALLAKIKSGKSDQDK